MLPKRKLLKINTSCLMARALKMMLTITLKFNGYENKYVKNRNPVDCFNNRF